MEDRALSDGVRRSMLRTIVPFGFVNVGLLLLAPLMFALVIGDRVDVVGLRRWVVAVWIGAALQLAVLLIRRHMWERSFELWERIYGVIELYIGASCASVLALTITVGDPLSFQMAALCFFMMCTAASVVAFAGSPHVGRSFLAGLWITALAFAAVDELVEVAALGLLSWPASVLYLAFATRLLRRSTSEHHRSSQLSRELAELASTDPLTGLLNRRSTLMRAQQAMDSAGALTALFIDLDGFKEINDRFGHATGDTVLINVARCLEEICRESDLVGRLGGDEFIVVLTDPADQHLGDLIATRYAGEIARCHGPIPELAITASVGAAPSIDGASAEDLLGFADSAMYRAKARGGNVAVHYLEPHQD